MKKADQKRMLKDIFRINVDEEKHQKKQQHHHTDKDDEVRIAVMPGLRFTKKEYAQMIGEEETSSE